MKKRRTCGRGLRRRPRSFVISLQTLSLEAAWNPTFVRGSGEFGPASLIYVSQVVKNFRHFADVLEEISDFKGIGPQARAKIAQSLTIRNFDYGRVICAENEEAQEMYILLKGKVRVTKKTRCALALNRGGNAARRVAGAFIFWRNSIAQ